MKLMKSILAALLLIGAVTVQASAEDIESPVALLERTSNEVLQILKDDHELLKKEPQRVYKIVDEKVLIQIIAIGRREGMEVYN